MSIPLPEISRGTNGTAHVFPIQIGMQTQGFIQGALFLAAFADIAAGEFVRLPDGVARVERLMKEQGLAEGVSDQGWQLVRQYKAVFEGTVFQSVLITLNSHWDWYVRRLCEFIRFGLSLEGTAALLDRDEKRLARADRLPLGEQLEVLELAIGSNLTVSANEREELTEMTLVRNLGLHNRWEIDAGYLRRTKRSGMQAGELRLMDLNELLGWHSLLLRLLRVSAFACATRFRGAPDFRA
jgi:hypothetical protein